MMSMWTKSLPFNWNTSLMSSVPPLHFHVPFSFSASITFWGWTPCTVQCIYISSIDFNEFSHMYIPGINQHPDREMERFLCPPQSLHRGNQYLDFFHLRLAWVVLEDHKNGFKEYSFVFGFFHETSSCNSFMLLNKQLHCIIYSPIWLFMDMQVVPS